MASPAVSDLSPDNVTTSNRIALYSVVMLRRPVAFHGIVFPLGALGVIVEIQPGDAYEVELSDPAERVVAIAGADLVQAS